MQTWQKISGLPEGDPQQRLMSSGERQRFELSGELGETVSGATFLSLFERKLMQKFLVNGQKDKAVTILRKTYKFFKRHDQKRLASIRDLAFMVNEEELLFTDYVPDHHSAMDIHDHVMETMIVGCKIFTADSNEEAEELATLIRATYPGYVNCIATKNCTVHLWDPEAMNDFEPYEGGN